MVVALALDGMREIGFRFVSCRQELLDRRQLEGWSGMWVAGDEGSSFQRRQLSRMGVRMGHARNWYCIHTKLNHEETVCRRFGELSGIEVLNPELKRKKCVRKKLVDVVGGLFSWYIFSKFDPSRYHHMITYTNGVKRFVGNRWGVPYAVDDSIIECIRSRMTDGVICCDPPKMSFGDSVVIVEGPFREISGVSLNELRANERVRTLLDAIALQVRIEVPSALSRDH